MGLFYIIPKLFSIIFAIYNQYYKSLTNFQINIFLWYKLNLNKNNRKNDQHISLKPIFDKKNKSHSDIDIIVPLNKEEYSMKKFISLDTKLCLLLCGLYLEVPKKILVRKRVIY